MEVKIATIMISSNGYIINITIPWNLRRIEVISTKVIWTVKYRAQFRLKDQ